jgi:hypothetical protein
MDSGGDLWITNGVDIYRRDGESWIPLGASPDLGVITNMIIDSVDVIWATVEPYCDYWTNECTRGGLLRYDGEFSLFNATNTILPTLNLEDIVCDLQNQLWIGTREGLYKYDGEAFTHYTEANSPLSSDGVTSLAVSPEGDLWIGTTWGYGLNVFNEGGLKSLGEAQEVPPVQAVPNPMETYTDLLWTQEEKEVVRSLELYNITGQVQSVEYAENGEFLRLYRDDLAAGMYLVLIHTSTRTHSCKLLVQ